MSESRTLFFSLCKTFCNSVNRYKSFTITIFSFTEKNRVPVLLCHPLAVIFTPKLGSSMTGTAMCSLQVSPQPPSSLLI